MTDPPQRAEPSEAELLARARQGEQQAFEAIVRRHQHEVYRLALRMLGEPSEAEDVAQEVFVSAFLHLDRFEARARLSTWLYRVTVNHCHNRLRYLRRRGRGRHRPLSGPEEERLLQGGRASGAPLGSPPPRPDQALEGRETAEALQRALQSLSEEHRILVVLRELEQLSYERIAEITELPLGTVKSRLHRARMALVAALGRIQGEEGSRR